MFDLKTHIDLLNEVEDQLLINSSERDPKTLRELDVKICGVLNIGPDITKPVSEFYVTMLKEKVGKGKTFPMIHVNYEDGEEFHGIAPRFTTDAQKACDLYKLVPSKKRQTKCSIGRIDNLPLNIIRFALSTLVWEANSTKKPG